MERDLDGFCVPGLATAYFLMVGFSTVPPEYPETTFSTPLTRSNSASVHQKHPAPNVADSSLRDLDTSSTSRFGLSWPAASRTQTVTPCTQANTVTSNDVRRE